MIEVAINRLDSPIQARLAEALVVASAYYTTRPETLRLETERPIGKYRVDFAITVTVASSVATAGVPDALRTEAPIAGYVARLVVEADGKDWHDAAKDAERDTWLASEGWEVLRFTGSQIHASAVNCAAEALRIMESIRELENINAWHKRWRVESSAAFDAYSTTDPIGILERERCVTLDLIDVASTEGEKATLHRRVDEIESRIAAAGGLQ